MSGDDQRTRKPYQPPAVTIISLRPEEAVLGSCKNSTSAGPGQSACNQVGGGACSGHSIS